MCVQWNLSNLDTFGREESALSSEVSLCQVLYMYMYNVHVHVCRQVAKCVLFIKVFSFQGAHIKGPTFKYSTVYNIVYTCTCTNVR